MGFRYETHMHTSEASACAGSTGAEMARAHKEAGYDGIFVTDHFFNGNSAIPRDLPWIERVHRFCLGYAHAKTEGEKIGLKVFFGFEFNFHGAEFLVYNLDESWLAAHEDVDRWRVREALSAMREDGAFIVQAHPFRERDYIDHIQLFPRDIDGVEAVNAAHHGEEGRKMNERAFAYAGMYGLPVTGGSDSHGIHGMNGGGIETDVPIEIPMDYYEAMTRGKLRII